MKIPDTSRLDRILMDLREWGEDDARLLRLATAAREAINKRELNLLVKTLADLERIFIDYPRSINLMLLKGALLRSSFPPMDPRGPRAVIRAYKEALKLHPSGDPYHGFFRSLLEKAKAEVREIKAKLSGEERRRWYHDLPGWLFGASVAFVLFGFPGLIVLLWFISPTIAFWAFFGWSAFYLILLTVFLLSGKRRAALGIVAFSLSMVASWLSDVITGLAILAVSAPAAAFLWRFAWRPTGPVASLLAGSVSESEGGYDYRYRHLLSEEESKLTLFRTSYPRLVRLNRPYPLVLRLRFEGTATVNVAAPDCIPSKSTLTLHANGESRVTFLLVPRKGGVTVITVSIEDESGRVLGGEQLVVKVEHLILEIVKRYLQPVGAGIGATIGAIVLISRFFPT